MGLLTQFFLRQISSYSTFNFIGNWSDYEEMMMEKFGKALQPHRVKTVN